MAKPPPFNPCACWSLKDGCISAGVWTLICAVIQLGMFGWQTSVVRFERDKSANSRAQWFGTLDHRDSRFPAYYEQYYETPEERFFLGLFIIQIIHLISDFFLLISAIALILGITRNWPYLIWPYFPCILISILANLGYFGVWMASPASPSVAESQSTIRSVRERLPYWSVLTAIVLIATIINIYCFIVVIAGYLHLRRGILNKYGYYLEQREKVSNVNVSNPSRQTNTVTVYDDDNAPNCTPGRIGSVNETKVIPEEVTKDAQMLAGAPGWTTVPDYSHIMGVSGNPNFPSTGMIANPAYWGTLPSGNIPPYIPAQSAPNLINFDNNAANTNVKQEFTRLWLNGVQPGNNIDPAPITVFPPTKEVLEGSARKRHHRRRKRHSSRSHSPTATTTTYSRTSRTRSRHRSRESETDTSTDDDDETRSRRSVRSRTSRASNHTCDTCQRRYRSSSRHSRKGRQSDNSNEESDSFDTGYSDFSRSRHDDSDSEVTGTSRQSNRRRREGSGRRPYSDDDRSRRRPRDVKRRADGRQTDSDTKANARAAPPRPPKPGPGPGMGPATITIPYEINIPAMPPYPTGTGNYTQSSTLPASTGSSGAPIRQERGNGAPAAHSPPGTYQLNSGISINRAPGGREDGIAITTSSIPPPVTITSSQPSPAQLNTSTNSGSRTYGTTAL